MSNRRRGTDKTSFNLGKHIFKREIGCKTNRFSFYHDLNRHRLENLSLSRHRDVKVVGHGAITSVAIDPLEWRYILAGEIICKFSFWDCAQSENIDKLIKNRPFCPF